jgi:hypothetical protein
MKTKFHLGRGAAILACAASLAGTAVAVAPTAASARTASTCANQIVAVTLEPGQTLHFPVKAITVQGVTCPEAHKVIKAFMRSEKPKGWKAVTAHFKPPAGLVPQEIKKGSKSIKYAIQGG